VRWADHPSREVLLSEVCLSVIVKPRQWGGSFAHLGLLIHKKNELLNFKKSEPFKKHPKFWKKIIENLLIMYHFNLFWSKKEKNWGMLNFELLNFGGVCRSRSTNGNSLHVAVCAVFEFRRQLEKRINCYNSSSNGFHQLRVFPTLRSPRDLCNKNPLLLQTVLKDWSF